MAYPFPELRRLREPVTDLVGGSTIVVHYDKKSRSAHATDPKGAPVQGVTATWEGWKTFHLDTRVFRAPRK